MGHLGQRMRGLGQRFLFTDEPEPGFLQGVFALLFFTGLTLRLVGEATFDVTSWPALALGLVLAGWAAAVVTPWDDLPRWAVGVLPVLDLAALGLARLDSSGATQTGTLVVVPALWLGRQFGVRGAGTAVLVTIVLVSLPDIAYRGPDAMVVTRALMIAIVAGWAAVAIASALNRLRASLVTLENERRFSDAILDTVDVGLVLLAADGGYRAINRRHQDFLTLAFPEGHEGQSGQVGDVYDADGTVPLTREQMPTYRASHGEEYDDVRMWVGADPLTRRALSVSARRVRSDDGEFAGAALAYTDVTDFMRLLKVKDEFVQSVSHELRTPLTSIIGYVNILLERDDLPDDIHSQLEVVSRNTDRLYRLVADLLQTAKATAGPMHLDRTDTDLAAIVRDSVEAAGPGAEKAGIEVHVAAPESLMAMVDPQRMSQVVDNLVSNAIKYSHRGGLVQVSLGIDADRVELCVIDSGIGIAEADRDRLFNRFFRARHAEEQAIQGVGLGLSITKSIVESHGGRIEVESELGRGSVFRVRLPVTPQAQ